MNRNRETEGLAVLNDVATATTMPNKLKESGVRNRTGTMACPSRHRTLPGKPA